MPVINILDENIINKIAAGEVIERPASVVKELMENSVDANSTFITVEIENAGKNLIKITDNGKGMDKQDAVLALQRHATSKITKADDLFSILTFGFRGEALSSISAISNFKIKTKTNDDVVGTAIEIRGGKFISHNETACNNGTVIEVRNIFFNTPARKKYLKTSQTELSNIIDTFVNIAIPENNIHFKLILDNKEIYNLPPAETIYERIFLIFGKDIAEKLIYIENFVQGIKMFGWFSKPELNKKSRKYQNVFVNNRYVKNISITYAVEAPYKSLLPRNHYPVFFIFLDINPNLVDVNVHPSKREIKFSNDFFVKSFVTKSISQSIYKKDLSYNYNVSSNKLDTDFLENKKAVKKGVKPLSAEIVFNDDYNKETHISNDLSNKNSSSDTVTSIGFKENASLSQNATSSGFKENASLSQNATSSGFKENASLSQNATSSGFKQNFSQSENEISSVYKENLSPSETVTSNGFKENASPSKFPISNSHQKNNYNSESTEFYSLDNAIYIGQLFNTYLIFQQSDNMLIIDQHALHEKILYQKIMNNICKNKIPSQMLIMPINVDMPKKDIELIEKNLSEFEKAGFLIEIFSSNSIILRSVPTILGKRANDKKIMIDIIDEIIDNRSAFSKGNLIDTIISTAACRSAVKAGDKMLASEAQELIKLSKDMEINFFCPHGRPVIVKMNQNDIEKNFLRRN